MTHSDFLALFPGNDACLEYLKERFYPDGGACPRCGKPSKFHRITGRTAYSCQYCGSHVYPTANTIFHKSRTGLQRWFWAVFLISSTRGQISVRQLERELGVTYKTANRMLTQIRGLVVGEVSAEPAIFAAREPTPEAAPTPAPSRSPVWHRTRRRA